MSKLLSNQYRRNSLHHIPQLDGVRGIAIFLVLIFHYVASSIDPQSSFFANLVGRVLGLAWSGVDLFFVLSGFLIGGILLENRLASNYFKVFYIRRICRIFPLYYAWLILFIVITRITPIASFRVPIDRLFENPFSLWSYATLTQNIAMALNSYFGPKWLGMTWSLAVEEQFYLTLPLIIRFIPPRRLPYLLITLIIATPILRTLLLFVSPYAAFANFVLMPCRADALLLGVLGAYLMREENIARWFEHHTKILYFVFVIFLLGATLLDINSPSPLSLVITTYGYSGLAVLYLCLILLAVTDKQSIIAKLTGTHFFRRIGIIAYGLYIIHDPINDLCHALILNQIPQLQVGSDLLVTFAALCLTSLTAYLSWNFFEKRYVVWGHSFRYNTESAN